MHFKSNQLQLQYQGFKESNFFWISNDVKELKNIEIKDDNINQIDLNLKTNLRLGKLVEQFVLFDLQQDKSTTILAENIQIQNGKLTIGELDCLLLKGTIPIHLEISYKFYLYDSTVGISEIEHWIGPNRRDSFIQKYDKLIHKQLPLLYHKQTQPLLTSLKLNVNDIQQKVYFKAQLFVPLVKFKTTFPIINNNCIVGFYIYKNELPQFSDCKFYIPTKHNWLLKPMKHVNWLAYNDYYIEVSQILKNNNSPLCWLKKTNGELFKFFLVYW